MPPIDLVALATSRLKALFPKDFQRMLGAQAAHPIVAAVASTNGRCCIRACVFPSVVDGLCRGHSLDARSEKSLLPSTTQAAISNLGMVVTL